MDVLVLKLVATPILIGAASLAGRRWGGEVGGWLVGIPFTSGPIALFLALGLGVHFAAEAAVGILAGTISQAAFVLAYAWIAVRAGWGPSLAAASTAFLIVTAVLSMLVIGAVATFAVSIGSLIVAIVSMPRLPRDRRPPVTPPWWDIPARMATATAFVLALTAAAPLLGPRLAGLLAPFPLYATVLATFSHRLEGPASAVAVLKGLLAGLFAFALFFLCLALLLEPSGIAFAFTVAVVLALAAQGVSLAVTRRVGVAS